MTAAKQDNLARELHSFSQQDLNPTQEIKSDNVSNAECISVSLINPAVSFPPSEFPAKDTVIEKKLVHKAKAINVLISDPVALSEEMDVYRTCLNADENNVFFFDHPVDHEPDVMLIAALRQFSVGVSHKFLNVSLDTSFVLHNLNISFSAAAHLEEEVILDMQVQSIKKLTSQSARDVRVKVWIHQNGKICGTGTGYWSVLPKRIAAKLFSM